MDRKRRTVDIDHTVLAKVTVRARVVDEGADVVALGRIALRVRLAGVALVQTLEAMAGMRTEGTRNKRKRKWNRGLAQAFPIDNRYRCNASAGSSKRRIELGTGHRDHARGGIEGRFVLRMHEAVG